MKKILLLVDVQNPDRASLDFTCYLGRLTGSPVTGVFLEGLVKNAARDKWHQPVMEESGVAGELPVSTEGYGDDTAAAIHWFREGCCNREVSCLLHYDRGTPVREIIQETRYADLLVVDPKTSLGRYDGQPSGLVKDVLVQAECPVIIAPGEFMPPEEIVFSFDGSQSSVFAMKQFNYLFPELQNKQVIVLEAKSEGHFGGNGRLLLKEWLKDHYASVRFEKVSDDSDTALLTYLLSRKRSFVVMGAYGRNRVSRFFRESSAELLIKTLSQPLFITHF